MKILAYSWNQQMNEEAAAHAISMGAEVVTVDTSGLPDDDSHTIALAAKAVAESEGVDLLLLGASKRGKDVGPRVAALLDLPFAGDIQSIERDGDDWVISRMVLSGNSLATYKMGSKCVVTFTAGTFEDAAGEARAVSPGDIPASPVKVTGHAGAADSDFNLTSADYVVGVGRGFKAKDDIKLAEDMAAKLSGGAVGCSRPVAADLKWLGEEHWIGLSGHEIKPKVYFAAGVSGQIQHVAGIRGSKLIVAINTNPDAPIFQISDYGIVGDLYDVLPKLTAALE